MRRSTFFAFIAPSFVLMLLFIATPLVIVGWQSLHQERGLFHDVKVETCSPGFLRQTCTTEIRSQPVRGADGKAITETRFVGLDNFAALLQPDLLGRALSGSRAAFAELLELDFYRALRFTLTFTFATLPLVLGLGLAIALAVDATVRSLRGPAIFVSLLPYVITPVVGALSIRWLFVGDGIGTAGLEGLTGQRILMLTSGWTMELLMLFYRVWHVAPFAFLVFYAGLQTVDQSTMEAAVVDGATRLQRLRTIVLPHLAPLVVFVALIQMMDSYRVFEEVVGFASQSYRISLQWLTFHYLTADNTGNRAVSRASASAILTMVGIVLLLIPLLMRTWREHRGK